MDMNQKKVFTSNLWANILVDVQPNTEYIAKAQRIPQVFDDLREESSVHLLSRLITKRMEIKSG